MAALSPKLRSVRIDDARRGLSFWCPGCNGAHRITTEGPGAWAWDGNAVSPTFSPSVLVTVPWSKSLEPGDDPAQWRDEICHSFVRSGNIEFLGDSTHALAGKTVPLPDWPVAAADPHPGGRQ